MRYKFSVNPNNTDAIGNCYEMAIALYMSIMLDKRISTDIKNKIFFVGLGSEDDHCVILIKSESDEKSIVLDPWLKYVDSPPVSGYRPKWVTHGEKKRGYIGFLTSYLKYLSAHEDGLYIKKTGNHSIGNNYKLSTSMKLVKINYN
jgi:hypothetical protein